MSVKFTKVRFVFWMVIAPSVMAVYWLIGKTLAPTMVRLMWVSVVSKGASSSPPLLAVSAEQSELPSLKSLDLKLAKLLTLRMLPAAVGREQGAARRC